MYKLANQTLDVYDDMDKSLLRKLATLYPSLNVADRTKLVDEDYALSIITKRASKLNKFPIDSAESTWISGQYLAENYSRLPKLAQEIAASNIKVASIIFDVEVPPILEKIAGDHYTNVYYEQDGALEKTAEASDMSKFSEIEKICGNETFAKYAFATPADVKLGTEYFEEYQKEIPPEYRHKYACAIQKRAGELGMEIKGSIEKHAGNAYNAHLQAHLSTRKTLVNDKYAEALDKMASMKNDMRPSEFASLLHQFDKRANLERYYGNYLTNPYESTFAMMSNPKCLFKTASGTKINHDGLGSLMTEKYAKMKEYFGVSLADALRKDPMPIYESLPNDAKEIVAGIADGTL